MLKFGIEKLARNPEFYYHKKGDLHYCSNQKIKHGWELIDDKKEFPRSMESISKTINRSLHFDEVENIKNSYDKRRAECFTKQIQVVLHKDGSFIGNVQEVEYDSIEKKAVLQVDSKIPMFERVHVSMGYFGIDIGYLVDTIILL